MWFPRLHAYAPRSARRPRSGFTLIEVSLVIVIVGVGVLASAELLAVGTKANSDAHRLTTGLNLAANIREWAQAKTADEILAINGQNYSPARDARNQPITGLDDWQQSITARRMDPSLITSTGTPSSRLVELSVTVSYRGRYITTESWLIADTD